MGKYSLIRKLGKILDAQFPTRVMVEKYYLEPAKESPPSYEDQDIVLYHYCLHYLGMGVYINDPSMWKSDALYKRYLDTQGKVENRVKKTHIDERKDVDFVNTSPIIITDVAQYVEDNTPSKRTRVSTAEPVKEPVNVTSKPHPKNVETWGEKKAAAMQRFYDRKDKEYHG